MQAQKIQAHARATLRPLIAVLAVVAGAGAWADEPSPYYIGASQAFTHDSNVYRTPDGPADSYSSTGLLGGFDQTISRQRLYGSAKVNYNKYRSQSTLDNTSYGVNAGWDWATIDKLAGNVSASANQSLASFNGNTSEPTTTRNLLKAEQFSTSVRWGGDSVLTLNGAYGHSRVRYSDPASQSPESTGDTASFGANYQLGASLAVGTALRFTRSVAANTLPGTSGDNTTHGRNLDLLADWHPTAQTGVNARLSWTRQTNSGVGARDFSGLTGALTANYAPTAKLGFMATLSRDAGSNSSYFNVVNNQTGQAITGLAQNSQTTDSVGLGATYAATAKISVNAGYQYRHVRLVNQSGVGTATDSDNYRNATLGVNYAIARGWQLACKLARESRGVSGGAGFSYSDNSATCSAQFTLR
ncbi:MAG TPA: hypothetical protein VIM34_11930 [Burkholderiaceae bacterium]